MRKGRPGCKSATGKSWENVSRRLVMSSSVRNTRLGSLVRTWMVSSVHGAIVDGDVALTEQSSLLVVARRATSSKLIVLRVALAVHVDIIGTEAK